jgi:hypothetical protein
MVTTEKGESDLNEVLLPRGPERRGESDRRVSVERRFAERRDPVRAAAGRRGVFPFDRRIAERRMLERRENWPGQQAY